MSRIRLHLDPNTFAKAVLLFLYLFLVIASYVVGKVARDALFLEQFKAVKLPYADIAIAVIVGFVITGYVWLGRRWNLRLLLSGSLVVYAAASVGFWYFAHFYKFVWLFPLLYVFIGIFGVLATAQVWTLASYVLTTREAKRTFGIVGGGAIAGSIAGGFVSAKMARSFGTESLLLVTAVCMLLCIALVNGVWSYRTRDKDSSEEPLQQESSIFRSMQEVYGSAHLRGIAILICLSSFVTTIAGWQFKAIAQQNIESTNSLAAFFGNFNSYAGLAALAVQLVLTAPLLRRFGIAPGLMVLPLCMLLGNIGVLVLGSLLAVAALRGFDQVLRYSVDKSSVELLYLPVPSNIKVQTKSFIDTVVWRFGDGLAGILVLVFVGTVGLSPTQMSWISLPLLAGWITVALRTRSSYVELLREGIHNYKLMAEENSATYLDRSALTLFSENLRGVKADDILYGLKLLEMEPRPHSLPAVRDLLDHPVAEVRKRAVSVLTTARDAKAEPKVATLMEDEDVRVAIEARLYMVSRGEKISPAPGLDCPAGLQQDLWRVLQLARSDDGRNVAEVEKLLDKVMGMDDCQVMARTAVAKLLSVLPDRFDRQLSKLLDDPDESVAREAVRAAGRLGSRKVLPALIEKATSEAHREEAVSAAALYGDRGIGTMRDYLHDRRERPEIRTATASALGRIASNNAARVLEEALIEDDEDVRHEVIVALNEIYTREPNVHFNTQPVEAALAAEIADHYTSYASIASIASRRAGQFELQDGMRRELERIFRLLSLVYPKYDLLSVHFGVLSDVPTVYDNALEMLENVVNPSIRSVLVPLLDNKIPIVERADMGTQLFGTVGRSRQEIASAFLKTNNSWLRASGAYIFSALGECGCLTDLEMTLEDPDPQVRVAGELAMAKLREFTRALAT